MAIIHRPVFSVGNGNIGGAAAGGDFSFEIPPDSVDPLHPEVTKTEHIEIVPVGPAGEYGINLYPAHPTGDWDDTAIVWNNVNAGGDVVPQASWQYIYLRARHKLTAQGAGASPQAVIMQVGANDLLTSLIVPVLLYISGTTLTLEVYSFNSGTLSGTHSVTIDEGWHVFETRFKPGTVVGSWADVESDGFVTVYMDGVAVIDLQAIDFYINEFEGTDNRFSSYAIGHFGLYGPVYDVELGYPEVAPNDSTPCCADRPDPAGPGNPGPTLGPDPYAPLPEWSRQCEGGGTVPQAADQTDSESWVV